MEGRRAATATNPDTPPPASPAPAAPALNPRHLAQLETLRADLENWMNVGRALLARVRDVIIDSKRR